MAISGAIVSLFLPPWDLFPPSLSLVGQFNLISWTHASKREEKKRDE